MKGTEKQVRWAEQIKAKFFQEMDELRAAEELLIDDDEVSEIRDFADSMHAEFWIKYSGLRFNSMIYALEKEGLQ